MDDYMAKPVRSSILETMLVKWMLKARSEDVATHGSFRSQHTDHDSNCADWPPSPSLNAGLLRQQAMVAHAQSSEVPDNPMGLGRFPSAENEGERSLRRVAAEEKAHKLRDDKLLSAAATEREQSECHHPQLSPSSDLPFERTIPNALTEENIGKLKKQQDAEQEGRVISLDRPGRTSLKSAPAPLHDLRRPVATQEGTAPKDPRESMGSGTD